MHKTNALLLLKESVQSQDFIAGKDRKDGEYEVNFKIYWIKKCNPFFKLQYNKL